MAKGGAGNKIRTIVCAGCRQTVTGRFQPGRRYCSHECYRIQPRPERVTGEHRWCSRCGSRFYVCRSRIDRGEGQFCSLECHNANQGRAKTDHSCKVCGAAFRWSPSRTASGKYNVTYCSLPCRDADPDRATVLAEANARRQRGRITSTEREGYALLDRLGIPHLRQVTFAGKFVPDAVVPAARLVVQFDGDYWHDRKGVSTEPRIRRRVALDRSQDAYVRACGWEVARLWDSELVGDPEGCARRLTQLIHRPLPVAPSRVPVALE